MWTQDDDLLFLKYCSSKRDRCYHAISRDSSCDRNFTDTDTVKVRSTSGLDETEAVRSN
jgi:hypothetical protein